MFEDRNYHKMFSHSLEILYTYRDSCQNLMIETFLNFTSFFFYEITEFLILIGLIFVEQ